jgi:hypothetical protein
MDILPGADELDYKLGIVRTSNAHFVGRDVTSYLTSAIFDAYEQQFIMETFQALCANVNQRTVRPHYARIGAFPTKFSEPFFCYPPMG